MYQLYRLRELGLSARLRGRHRCRRHLVLEPLSRRALRFGKLDLRLFLLRGAAAGMGLEGAFLRPARHAGIPELRRRQVRPAPGHAVPLSCRRRAHWTTRAIAGPSPWKAASRRARGSCSPRSASLGLHAAEHSRPRELSGPGLSHLRAGRTRRWISPASASASSAPAPPPSRRSPRSPSRRSISPSSSARPNWAAPLHNQRSARRRWRRSRPATTRSTPTAGRQHLVHPPGRSAQDAGRAARGARGVLGKALCRAGLRHLDGQFPRHPDRREGQRRAQRIHRQEDPPAREGPQGRRQADPERPRLRHAPACRWRAAISRPTTATTSCWSTSTRRRSSASRRSGIKTSDEEHEFDILIYATGFDGVTGAFDRIDIVGPGGRAAQGRLGDGSRAPISACSPRASPTC